MSGGPDLPLAPLTASKLTRNRHRFRDTVPVYRTHGTVFMGRVPCRAMIGWFGKKNILPKNGVLKLVRRPPTLRKMLWSRYYAQWHSNYKFCRQNKWISISNTNLAAQGYFWAFKLRACCDQASVSEALAYKKCWGSRMNKNEYKWMYTIFKTMYYCLKINLKLVTLSVALDVVRKGWYVA